MLCIFTMAVGVPGLAAVPAGCPLGGEAVGPPVHEADHMCTGRLRDGQPTIAHRISDEGCGAFFQQPCFACCPRVDLAMAQYTRSHMVIAIGAIIIVCALALTCAMCCCCVQPKPAARRGERASVEPPKLARVGLLTNSPLRIASRHPHVAVTRSPTSESVIDMSTDYRPRSSSGSLGTTKEKRYQMAPPPGEAITDVGLEARTPTQGVLSNMLRGVGRRDDSNDLL